MIIVKTIYQYSAKLPDHEKFGLISQLTRCCISLPANIAEGSGRTQADFGRFLRISLSSSYELETLLIIAADLYNNVDETIFSQLKSFQNKTKAFIKSIEK